MFSRILIGIDGRPGGRDGHPAVSGQELVQAELLAVDVDCTTAVRPASSAVAGLHEPAEQVAELDDLLNDRVSEAQTRLAALGDCQVLVRRGDPAERLREFSADVSGGSPT